MRASPERTAMPTSHKILAAVILSATFVSSHADAQTVPAATVTALADALKDSDADVRRQAAWAMGRIRCPKAVDALTAALKDSNTEVRRSAAQALAMIYGNGGGSPNANPN